VLAELPGDDVILCPLTTQGAGDPFAIGIDDNDFETGGLRRPSSIRPGRLFTADSSIILYRAGRLRQQVVRQAIERAVAVLTGDADS
jgi:mRNA interferase MazF